LGETLQPDCICPAAIGDGGVTELLDGRSNAWKLCASAPNNEAAC
jgi:hypothetical protein